MTTVKAVLFDMDGVLIDAKDWHYEALNRALDLFGMTISRDEHLSTFDGLPTRDKLKMLTKSRNLPQSLHQFLNNLKQKFTVELAYARCKPLFHHQYALSRLSQQGYRLAVCSNSIRNTVELLMKLSALEDHLEFTLSNEEVTYGKPHPEMYQLACQKMNLQPTECLVVEDNENGIRAAEACGCPVLAVSTVNDVNYTRIQQKIAELEGA
ncbi:MAG: HAD family phosphatase [Microcoleaceae cyanobacterium]